MTSTPGDYLNWTESQWEIIGSNVEEIYADFEDVCGGRDKEKVLFPAPMLWENADRTCRKFGGRLATFNSSETYESFDRYFSRQKKLQEGFCGADGSVWLGITTSESGQEMNHYTGEMITWDLPWGEGISRKKMV